MFIFIQQLISFLIQTIVDAAADNVFFFINWENDFCSKLTYLTFSTMSSTLYHKYTFRCCNILLVWYRSRRLIKVSFWINGPDSWSETREATNVWHNCRCHLSKMSRRNAFDYFRWNVHCRLSIHKVNQSFGKIWLMLKPQNNSSPLAVSFWRICCGRLQKAFLQMKKLLMMRNFSFPIGLLI